MAGHWGLLDMAEWLTDRAMRDNLRDALLRFRIPLLTAFWSALSTSLSRVRAVSRSLPSIALLTFFIRVFILDLTC
jgi:hypothetical protein